MVIDFGAGSGPLAQFQWTAGGFPVALAWSATPPAVTSGGTVCGTFGVAPAVAGTLGVTPAVSGTLGVEGC